MTYRRTVAMPEADYEIAAGSAAAVVRRRSSPGSASDHVDVAVAAGFRVLGWVARRLRWRRRGMVAVTQGSRRWSWTTRSAAVAKALAPEVERLLRSHAWRPGTTEPPVFAGAEPYER